jgi:hypothetical protein
MFICTPHNFLVDISFDLRTSELHCHLLLDQTSYYFLVLLTPNSLHCYTCIKQFDSPINFLTISSCEKATKFDYMTFLTQHHPQIFPRYSFVD